jgi:glycosyltransferase involved in cell wall biosynthesis
VSTPISCLGSVYSGSSDIEVKQALESLLNNSLPPSEVVVVIDGPITVRLEELLSGYVHIGAIKTVRSKLNLGLGLALRLGLNACTFDIVCRFDTDDINLENRLSVLVEIFDTCDPLVDIVSSSVLEFYDTDSILVHCRLKHSLLTHRALARGLDFRNTINHPAVAFRQSSILSVGSYEDVLFFEDFYLWLKARKAGLRFAGIDQPLVCMRRAPGLKRRSGFKYSLCELRFVLKCLHLQLLPFHSLPIMAIRIFSRLLPSRLQSFQDYLPWRNGYSLCRNPSSLSRYSLENLGLNSSSL